MKHYLIAKRYAKALAESIGDDARLDSVRNWLSDFAAVLDGNSDLHTALVNPAIEGVKRQAVLDEILEKTGADPLGAKLVREVFRRGRIAIIADIAEVFSEFADVRLGRIAAHLTTARPLSEADAERIRAGLAAYSGKDVRTTTAVDPEIIGGIVVRIDGAVIDGSLRARLQQIRNALLSEENGTP